MATRTVYVTSKTGKRYGPYSYSKGGGGGGAGSGKGGGKKGGKKSAPKGGGKPTVKSKGERKPSSRDLNNQRDRVNDAKWDVKDSKGYHKESKAKYDAAKKDPYEPKYNKAQYKKERDADRNRLQHHRDILKVEEGKLKAMEKKAGTKKTPAKSTRAKKGETAKDYQAKVDPNFSKGLRYKNNRELQKSREQLKENKLRFPKESKKFDKEIVKIDNLIKNRQNTPKKFHTDLGLATNVTYGVGWQKKKMHHDKYSNTAKAEKVFKKEL